MHAGASTSTQPSGQLPVQAGTVAVAHGCMDLAPAGAGRDPFLLFLHLRRAERRRLREEQEAQRPQRPRRLPVPPRAGRAPAPLREVPTAAAPLPAPPWRPAPLHGSPSDPRAGRVASPLGTRPRAGPDAAALSGDAAELLLSAERAVSSSERLAVLRALENTASEPFRLTHFAEIGGAALLARWLSEATVVETGGLSDTQEELACSCLRALGLLRLQPDDARSLGLAEVCQHFAAGTTHARQLAIMLASSWQMETRDVHSSVVLEPMADSWQCSRAPTRSCVADDLIGLSKELMHREKKGQQVTPQVSHPIDTRIEAAVEATLHEIDKLGQLLEFPKEKECGVRPDASEQPMGLSYRHDIASIGGLAAGVGTGNWPQAEVDLCIKQGQAASLEQLRVLVETLQAPDAELTAHTGDAVAAEAREAPLLPRGFAAASSDSTAHATAAPAWPGEQLAFAQGFSSDRQPDEHSSRTGGSMARPGPVHASECGGPGQPERAAPEPTAPEPAVPESLHCCRWEGYFPDPALFGPPRPLGV
mmetsp:Transcript_28484/g.90775  ORF Transcript_28484/g.90775 Transcript_28484/m.90775 type:complete len:535 (+) Transcript_28484:49-1653(+)